MLSKCIISVLKLLSFSKDNTISVLNPSKFVCNHVLTSRSKDEEIELVTLDDFYKTAPSDISRTVSVIVTIDTVQHVLWSFGDQCSWLSLVTLAYEY